MQTDPIGYEDQMNLYAYVGNDPLNYTDPTGMVKVSFGISAELVVKVGLRAGVSVSFDTETLEVGGSATVGGRAGLSAGVGVTGSIAESGSQATNSVNAKASLNGDASLGPVSVGGDLVSASTEDGIEVLGGGPEGTVLGDIEPKTSAQLKLGGSVGVDGTIEGTSSVVSDIANAAVEAIDNFEQSIKCSGSSGGPCN